MISAGLFLIALAIVLHACAVLAQAEILKPLALEPPMPVPADIETEITNTLKPAIAAAIGHAVDAAVATKQTELDAANAAAADLQTQLDAIKAGVATDTTDTVARLDGLAAEINPPT